MDFLDWLLPLLTLAPVIIASLPDKEEGKKSKITKEAVAIIFAVIIALASAFVNRETRIDSEETESELQSSLGSIENKNDELLKRDSLKMIENDSLNAELKRTRILFEKATLKLDDTQDALIALQNAELKEERRIRLENRKILALNVLSELDENMETTEVLNSNVIDGFVKVDGLFSNRFRNDFLKQSLLLPITKKDREIVQNLIQSSERFNKTADDTIPMGKGHNFKKRNINTLKKIKNRIRNQTEFLKGSFQKFADN